MAKRIPCPRCGNPTLLSAKLRVGCLLCDDTGFVSPTLAAAYRLLCIDGLPGRLSIERIREDLGE